MKRIKNEEKERIGKVVFGIAISLPILLILGCFLPMLIIELNGCGKGIDSLKKS